MSADGNIARVIIHADDLGLSLGFNAGILPAAIQGIITSTCLRVNGCAYREAIDDVLPHIPHIGVGLHLNIVEGFTRRQLHGRETALCDADGRFKLTFVQLYLARKNPELLREIEDDYRNQIEIALADVGKLDHLNSHQHSHVIPQIFKICCRLAKEYGIPFVRLPAERSYLTGELAEHLRSWFVLNVIKHMVVNGFARTNRKTARRYDITTNDAFVGVLYTGHMNSERVLKGIEATQPYDSIVEVLLHPATATGLKSEEYIDSKYRDYIVRAECRTELRASMDLQLGATLAKRYKLTNSRILARPSGDAENNGPREQGVFGLPQVGSPPDAPVNGRQPLRTFVIIDETPFYHPEYLRRLIEECKDAEIIGAAIVVLPRGRSLQEYLLRNWRLLRLSELFQLAIKKIGLQLLGMAPRFIRGNFESSVRRVCASHGVPAVKVSSVNDDKFLSYIRDMAPDIILSSNSLVFKKKLLGVPRFGCINRHSSPLPAYGGLLPVFRSIQHGECFVAVAVHRMVEGIDEGEVLSRKWLPVFPGDTMEFLYRKCFILSFDATAEAIRMIRKSPNCSGVGNEGIEPSYFSFPKEKDWEEFRRNGGRFISIEKDWGEFGNNGGHFF